MKTPVIPWIIILILFIGCKNSHQSDSLSGIYAAHFKNEYYETSDTAVISFYSDNPTIYTVERRTGFTKINGNADVKKQYKRDMSRMTFDLKQNILEEERLGRRIRYIPEKSVILIGSTEYHLIK